MCVIRTPPPVVQKGDNQNGRDIDSKYDTNTKMKLCHTPAEKMRSLRNGVMMSN